MPKSRSNLFVIHISLSCLTHLVWREFSVILWWTSGNHRGVSNSPFLIGSFLQAWGRYSYSQACYGIKTRHVLQPCLRPAYVMRIYNERNRVESLHFCGASAFFYYVIRFWMWRYKKVTYTEDTTWKVREKAKFLKRSKKFLGDQLLIPTQNTNRLLLQMGDKNKENHRLQADLQSVVY